MLHGAGLDRMVSMEPKLPMIKTPSIMVERLTVIIAVLA